MLHLRRVAIQNATVDYDIDADRPPAGVTYHVAPGASSLASGVDAASATTPGTAINKPDVGTIVVHKGASEYWHDETFGLIKKSINLIAADGERPTMTGCYKPATLSWTAHFGHIYATEDTDGALAQVVYDKRTSQRTAWNDAPLYTKKADLASITGPGQWAQVGTTLYVWALGDGNLATDASWLRVGRNNTFSGIVFNAPVTIYAEGINFEGVGWSAGATIAGVGSFNAAGHTALCKDVTIRYSVAAGFAPIGAEFFAAVDCAASSCIGDGFGHQSAGGFTYEFLEVNCLSHHHISSDPADPTINGFTSHDDCIGIRVGCKANNTRGPGFADVSGTKTWNVACESRDSESPQLYNKVGFQVLGGQMWLDSCDASGNNLGYVPGPEATLYYRNLGPGQNNQGVYPTGNGTAKAY